MKIIVRFLIAAALCAGCSSPTEPDKPYSGTIPVAVGNKWVYQHDYDYRRVDYSNRDSLVYHEHRQGLFKLSITNVSPSSFTLTAIDSGVKTINDTGISSFDSLFIQTENRPIQYSYNLTNYGYRAPPYPGGLSPLPNFLYYEPFPDTSIPYLQITMGLIISSYSKRTENAPVIVNGGDTSRLYSTTITYTSVEAGSEWYDNTDTSKWLDGVGVYNYSHTNNYYGETQNVLPFTHAVVRYSLISFNGSPVTVSQ